MTLVTSQSFALFVTGSTEPSSNVGPWLKDGVTWYIFSDTAGAYVPQTIEQASLGYFIGSTTPDQTVYQVWIETTVAGSPLSVKIYYGGAWVDVYAATLASYLTVAAAAATYAPLASPALTGVPTAPTAAAGTSTTQLATTAFVTTADALKADLASPTFTGVPAAPTAAPATNTTQLATTAFVTAAIAAIPAPSSFAAYPAQGVRNSQTVPISGAATFTKIAFNSAPINPTPAPFSTADNRYIAQADGIYDVSFSCQCDNSGGTAAAMEVNAALYKNGVFVGNLMADLDSTPSPNGSRWSPGFSGLVSLVATDYLEIFMAAADGVNAANLTVSAQISVHRVSA